MGYTLLPKSFVHIAEIAENSTHSIMGSSVC